MNTGDITKAEPNIHAGIKYISLMRDKFFANQPMDAHNKLLLPFAAYNAGSGPILQLKKIAEKRGLNPHLWFDNVEIIAGQRIRAETVTYVSNIYNYYIAYKVIEEQRAEREKACAGMPQSVITRQ